MSKPIERKVINIDASNRKLCRLASEIAILLGGKHKTDFMPNEDRGDIVHVLNVKDLDISLKKQENKKYDRHSGYPGGIKEKSLKEIFQNTPDKLLHMVVYNMLPKNKLRDRMIKRLKIK